MAEKLEVYDLDSNLLSIEDRKKFYKEIKEEFKKTQRVTRKVRTIRLLLMNSNGRIYLQKRSKIKSQNSGLYDKTVGGHVSAGDNFDMTVIRECAEELGFPATVLSPEDFERAKKVTNIEIIGIFTKIEYIQNFDSVRVNIDGTRFVQPHMTSFYFGYYDGPIRFVDGESCGIEVFSLDELEQEIRDNPNKFTEDIKWMLAKYKAYLKPL